MIEIPKATSRTKYVDDDGREHRSEEEAQDSNRKLTFKRLYENDRSKVTGGKTEPAKVQVYMRLGIDNEKKPVPTEVSTVALPMKADVEDHEKQVPVPYFVMFDWIRKNPELALVALDGLVKSTDLLGGVNGGVKK